MRVPIEKVPLDVRRRAARMLQSLSELAPEKQRRGLARARLGAEATPLYRPDLDEVAYWELEVEGIATQLPIDDDLPEKSDRGFIVVATGHHDVPIPHFSVELAPPSRRLDRYGAVDRVVKLDSMCYLAEDAGGTMLGHIGTVPPKLTGMPAPLPRRLPTGYAIAQPDHEADGDSDGDAPALRLKVSRDKRIEVSQWRSWEELRKSYADTYRHHLAALSARAEHPWRVEELTDKFGQGIREGESLDVVLLEAGDAGVEGPGAAFVEVALNPQPLPPRYRLTAKHPDGRDTTFQLVTSYGETLTFFVLPADAPTEKLPADSPLGPTMTGVLR